MKKLYKSIIKKFPRSAVLAKRITRPLRLFLDRRDTVKGNFQGNQFSRIEELDILLKNSRGLSILDIGMSDGLISYEFARHGASLTHGLEIDDERVRFAKRLFSNIPVKSHFLGYNLAVQKSDFTRLSPFLQKYDIVLFLGVYQHLKKQMNENELRELVKTIGKLTRNILVVRTNRLDEVEQQIFPLGFVRTGEFSTGNDAGIGKLGFYKRS